MTRDDESLLSAYLDGALAPAQRLALEAALARDARLAQRLRELAAVRALVAGLSRSKAPGDLAPAVLASLPAQPRRIVAPWRPVATMLAAAAAVMVAVTPFFRTHDRPHPKPAPAPANVAVAPTPTIVAPATPPSAPPAAPRPAVPDARGTALAEDRQRAHAFLDGSEPTTVLVGVDSLDAKALEVVRTAIRDTAPNLSLQAEIRLDPNRVVDPARPGAAVIYLTMLDGTELNTLMSRLHQRLPGQVRMAAPIAPEVAARLADADQMRFFESPARPSTRLDKPPAEVTGTMALRGSDGPPSNTPPDPENRPEPRPAGASKPAPPRPCLIWVTAEKH